ncbi:hypothetical protein N8D55_22735 (plasmid) [Xanthomonas hortorum pv. pelargonii]|nr:hypothetical protein N8D55_22735 [Xanthomonas hortorum pv. pelargonii]
MGVLGINRNRNGRDCDLRQLTVGGFTGQMFCAGQLGTAIELVEVRAGEDCSVETHDQHGDHDTQDDPNQQGAP